MTIETTYIPGQVLLLRFACKAWRLIEDNGAPYVSRTGTRLHMGEAVALVEDDGMGSEVTVDLKGKRFRVSRSHLMASPTPAEIAWTSTDALAHRAVVENLRAIEGELQGKLQEARDDRDLWRQSATDRAEKLAQAQVELDQVIAQRDALRDQLTSLRSSISGVQNILTNALGAR